MTAQMLAEGLQRHKYAANDNTVSYDADDPVAGAMMANAGLIEEKDALHAALASRPSEDMVGETGEPMADMPAKPDKLEHPLPEAAMAALAEKKKKRRFR